jgi:hypothetical protein
MAEHKGDWYKSKKGWASAMIAAAYFVIDHWGRAESARDIYRFIIGPARAVLPVISPYMPWILFAIALVFFEIERRKRAQPDAAMKGSANDGTTAGQSIRQWREAFSNPRWQIVDNHKFENDSIVVDGKSFRRCSFKNVKFLFHGTAPFEFQGPTDIDAGSIMFGTDDPAITWYETMQQQFAALPGAKLETTAKDAAGHDIVRKKPTIERIGPGHDGDDAKASPVAVPPHVIVVKIEHPEHGMTPETSITLKNVGKEVVQNVGVRPFTLSGKEVSFTQVAIIAIDAEKAVSPRIKGVVVLQQRDLLSVLESEWANTDVSKKEFTVRTRVRFEDLVGKSFEVPFDLVYCAHVHRLYKITQNERAKNQYVLLEARNFGPVKQLS